MENKGKKLTRKKLHEYGFVLFLMAIPIIHFLVFNLYVNVNSVFLSFKKYYPDENVYRWLSSPFENYKTMFKRLSTGGSLLLASRNSLIFTLLNNFFLMPASLVLTYFLFKKMPCETFFRVVFQLPSIISVVVLVMVYRLMFDSTIGIVNPMLRAIGLGNIIPMHGWLGTEKSAWVLTIGYCTWVGLGGNVLIFSGAMSRVPKDMIESAHIDGIGFWGEFWHIVVPLVGGTLSTLLLLGINVFFTYFLPVKLLTGGGPNGATMTIAMESVNYIKGGGADLTQSATLGMITALIGTPIIVGCKKLFEKVFPAYEF